MATKGQKFKHWLAEEKYKIIKPILDMEKSSHEITREVGLGNGIINNWIKTYRTNGMESLTLKRKPSNPLCKYYNKKNL